MAIAGCGSPGGSLSPTPGAILIPGSPTVTSLTVSGQPAFLRVGGSAALTVTARFSDGSSREVTAVWSTSNSAVAFVGTNPATGQINLLQGVAAGEADITATWTPASATTRIVVRDPSTLQELMQR
jgi:hypothetical protein